MISALCRQKAYLIIDAISKSQSRDSIDCKGSGFLLFENYKALLKLPNECILTVDREQFIIFDQNL